MVLDGEGEASPPVRDAVHTGSGVAAAAVVATVPAQNKKRAANRGNKDQVLSLSPSLLFCSSIMFNLLSCWPNSWKLNIET